MFLEPSANLEMPITSCMQPHTATIITVSMICCEQWHNRGGGQSAPETSDREISADLSGKDRQGKKRNMG